MPGPKPIPTHWKVLRGNPGKQRLPSEPEPEIDKNCPQPPPFLGAYARDEWWTTAPSLHRLGLLSVLDVACLAAYCHAYGQWRLAVEALARMESNDPLMSGLLIRTVDGNAKRNPLVKIAADTAADVLRFAGEFGLTPIARTRFAAGGFDPPSTSKFAGLLSDGGRILPLKPRGNG